MLQLARRYFSEHEAAALARMDGETARRAFLWLWTAKEASCKSTGTGIFGWLPQWQFEAASEQPALRAAPPEAGEAGRWRHWRIAPAPTHTAVIALHDGGVAPRLAPYRLELA